MASHFRTPEPGQEQPVVPAPAPEPAASHFTYAAPSVDDAGAAAPDAFVAPAPAPAEVEQPIVNPLVSSIPAVAAGDTGAFLAASSASHIDTTSVPLPDPAASALHVADMANDPVAGLDELSPEQAEEAADLNEALASPDFTTYFAPVEDSRREQARAAGEEPVILFEHVTKVYPAQPNKPALDDVNIEIYPGEFVFLVGHSGSGKTTLLRTMTRDVKPTSGRVLVAGQDLMRIKNRRVPFFRRQIGTVFQDFKLLPGKTVYENVAFVLQCIGKPRGVIRTQVPEVLRLVGLADQMDSMPDQISGGEQQRVSVARAMVNRPPLLICDEPTGNLDPAISLGIMKLLERINQTGTTVIVATHDREMVDSMHRRVIALEAGHVVRDQERGGYGNYGA